MKCPVCETVDLHMTERGGIEIDYCPQCRGVWLDRGELDKIIERTSGPTAAASAPTVASVMAEKRKRDEIYYDDDDYDDYDERRRSPQYRKSRKRSFFEDLFDIFD